ncbi:putative chaperone protein [Podospora didyma]|uniref:Chaperone protein n=1 Tax=Podospora didyma TaxID=330526 RepID=A0AAE0NQI0_9PEZI|nr:putative chaperone protein [Podospora didyma]
MAAKQLDTQTLGLVFHDRPDILASIQKEANSPARVNLFNTIASFVLEQLSFPSTNNNTNNQDEPSSKRRRVDIIPQTQKNGGGGYANGSIHDSGGGGADAAASETVLLEIKDISVVVPLRKKYDLCLTQNFLYARAPGSTVPVQGVVYPWREIEHAFYLPVPEKNQVQHNYVLFPRNSYLPTAKNAPPSTDLEPLVFTIPATAPKPGTILGPSAAAASGVSDSYSTLFNWALPHFWGSAGNHSTKLLSADAKLFHSAARQVYRPASEKPVHVKAFRGSKDGYLFFLPTGILWGFKKPLLFLPLDRIVALSYTSVLQRTFNIVVELDVDGMPAGAEKEIEFAMLDQEDYQGIDEMYVRRHGLADGSMAEARKAKRELAENAKKDAASGGVDGEGVAAGGVPGGAGADDGLTELERAQREAEQLLQDEEDEEEEDYDPGSEGESEGSGESDDDDDDDDDEDGEGGGEEDDDDEMEDGE